MKIYKKITSLLLLGLAFTQISIVDARGGGGHGGGGRGGGGHGGGGGRSRGYHGGSHYGRRGGWYGSGLGLGYYGGLWGPAYSSVIYSGDCDPRDRFSSCYCNPLFPDRPCWRRYYR